MLLKAKTITCVSDQPEAHACDILAADNSASLYFAHVHINISFYIISQWRGTQEPINVSAATYEHIFYLRWNNHL